MVEAWSSFLCVKGNNFPHSLNSAGSRSSFCVLSGHGSGGRLFSDQNPQHLPSPCSSVLDQRPNQRQTVIYLYVVVWEILAPGTFCNPTLVSITLKVSGLQSMCEHVFGVSQLWLFYKVGWHESFPYMDPIHLDHPWWFLSFIVDFFLLRNVQVFILFRFGFN